MKKYILPLIIVLLLSGITTYLGLKPNEGTAQDEKPAVNDPVLSPAITPPQTPNPSPTPTPAPSTTPAAATKQPFIHFERETASEASVTLIGKTNTVSALYVFSLTKKEGRPIFLKSITFNFKSNDLIPASFWQGTKFELQKLNGQTWETLSANAVITPTDGVSFSGFSQQEVTGTTRYRLVSTYIDCRASGKNFDFEVNPSTNMKFTEENVKVTTQVGANIKKVTQCSIYETPVYEYEYPVIIPTPSSQTNPSNSPIDGVRHPRVEN